MTDTIIIAVLSMVVMVDVAALGWFSSRLTRVENLQLNFLSKDDCKECLSDQREDLKEVREALSKHCESVVHSAIKPEVTILGHF